MPIDIRGYVTTHLRESVSEDKLKWILTAFECLIFANPEERHFVIRFANEDEGRGLEVWAIIDSYPASEGGKAITYLLPSDY